MSKNKLSLLIAAALFGVSGAALSQSAVAMEEHNLDVDNDGVVDATVRVRDNVELVTVADRARTIPDTRIESGGLVVNERQIDTDGDGVADAVVRVREDVSMVEALDAIADLETEPVDAKTGTDRLDTAAETDIATREAAGVAATDRASERTGGELRTRTLGISEREAAAMEDSRLEAEADTDVDVYDRDDDLRASVDDDVDVVVTDDKAHRDTVAVHSFDASTEAETDPSNLTMSETPTQRIGDTELATSDAGATAATDRVSERTGGELRTRTMDVSSAEAAARRGEEVDTDTMVVHDDDLRVDGRTGVHVEDRTVTGTTAATTTAAADRDLEIDTDRDVVVQTEGDVEVKDGQPQDAFASTAGTEGFSSGQTAAMAQDRFAQLDGDSDGALDEGELARESQLANSFSAYDINDDGEISRNEFQSWYAATDQSRDADIPRTMVAGTDDADLDVDVDADVDSELAQDDEDQIDYGDDY